MFHIGIATQHPPLPDPSQMSDVGIDFIEQCVTLDPTDRPSAVELIKHPWLTPMVDAMVSTSSPWDYILISRGALTCYRPPTRMVKIHTLVLALVLDLDLVHTTVDIPHWSIL